MYIVIVKWQKNSFFVLRRYLTERWYFAGTCVKSQRKHHLTGIQSLASKYQPLPRHLKSSTLVVLPPNLRLYLWTVPVVYICFSIKHTLETVHTTFTVHRIQERKHTSINICLEYLYSQRIDVCNCFVSRISVRPFCRWEFLFSEYAVVETDPNNFDNEIFIEFNCVV